MRGSWALYRRDARIRGRDPLRSARPIRPSGRLEVQSLAVAKESTARPLASARSKIETRVAHQPLQAVPIEGDVIDDARLHEGHPDRNVFAERQVRQLDGAPRSPKPTATVRAAWSTRSRVAFLILKRTASSSATITGFFPAASARVVGSEKH